MPWRRYSERVKKHLLPQGSAKFNWSTVPWSTVFYICCPHSHFRSGCTPLETVWLVLCDYMSSTALQLRTLRQSVVGFVHLLTSRILFHITVTLTLDLDKKQPGNSGIWSIGIFSWSCKFSLILSGTWGSSITFNWPRNRLFWMWWWSRTKIW